MLACRGLTVAAVKVLLDSGADILARDHEGASCIDYAVSAYITDDTSRGITDIGYFRRWYRVDLVPQHWPR